MKTLLFALIGAIVLAGCGSSQEATIPTADELFEKAKKLYDDEDYLEAITEFSVITLQHQGTSFADDAQFYLGECHFQRGEYLLGAFEYGQLKHNMPASPFVPEAQYKLGLSYYMLSPKSSLDQQYSVRAIDELQSFVEYYPENQHRADAENKIVELTLRLAKKDFDTANLYATMGYQKSAILYFDGIIERYHDTEYAPLSYLGKAEALLERNHFQEALNVLLKFNQVYPENELRNQAEKLKREIEDRLQSGSLSGAGSKGKWPSEIMYL